MTTNRPVVVEVGPRVTIQIQLSGNMYARLSRSKDFLSLLITNQALPEIKDPNASMEIHKVSTWMADSMIAVLSKFRKHLENPPMTKQDINLVLATSLSSGAISKEDFMKLWSKVDA